MNENFLSMFKELNRKYPDDYGHFDYRKTKRQWKGKQEQLINTIRSL